MEGVRRGESALVHGGSGEGWETDHVAHGVDVWHLGLIVLVHHEPSTVISLEAGKIEIQFDRVALPTCRVHDYLSGDLLA
jgi:hypothetical protein